MEAPRHRPHRDPRRFGALAPAAREDVAVLFLRDARSTHHRPRRAPQRQRHSGALRHPAARYSVVSDTSVTLTVVLGGHRTIEKKTDNNMATQQYMRTHNY